MFINYESRVLKRGDIYYVGREGEGHPAVLITSDEVLRGSPDYVSVIYISGSEAKISKDNPFYVKINKTGRPAVIECDNQNRVESQYVRQHIATLDEDEIVLMNEAIIEYQGLCIRNQNEMSRLQDELDTSKRLNEKLLNILEMRGNSNDTKQHKTKGLRRREKVSETAAGV